MTNPTIKELNETVKQSQPNAANLINIRKILQMMLKNWYFYLFGVAISIAGAFFYMKYKIPTYLVETTILIGEGNNGQQGEDLLQGFALRPGVQNLDNQILIVASHSMIRKAVDDLPFEVDVFRKGYRSMASYYPLSPIRIEPGDDGLPFDSEFIFQYNVEEEHFSINTSRDSRHSVDSVFTFGETIQLADGSFTVLPQPELEDIYKTGRKIFIS